MAFDAYAHERVVGGTQRTVDGSRYRELLLDAGDASGRGAGVFDDDDSAAGARVAMLSEEIADAGLIGGKILIEGQPFTIVGIVSKRYHGTNLNWGDPPRVWIPLQAAAIVQPRFRTIDIFHQRAAQWLLITRR